MTVVGCDRRNRVRLDSMINYNHDCIDRPGLDSVSGDRIDCRERTRTRTRTRTVVTYTSKQMLLEIELDILGTLFNHLEDLFVAHREPVSTLLIPVSITYEYM